MHLYRSAEGRGIKFAVYGSLAWQALTGLAYVTPTSDLDVLVTVRSERELMESLDLMKGRAGNLPLDGEVIFPNGMAVAWKEVDQLRKDGWEGLVLAKSLMDVQLIGARQFFTPLPERMPC